MLKLGIKKNLRVAGKVCYDHWLVIFEVVLAASFAGFLIFLRSRWSQIAPLFSRLIFYKVSVLATIFLSLTVILIGVAVLKLKARRKKSWSSLLFGRACPQYKREDFGYHKQFGVSWHLWVGSNTLFDGLITGRETKYLWADGPFCPSCSYKLDWSGGGDKWVCVNCRKKFKIPKEVREDTREKVIKIFEAYLRKESNGEK